MLGLLNDLDIIETFGRGTEGKIEPFSDKLVRTGISYGLSSVGYDLRLSPEDFAVFKKPGLLTNFVKRFTGKSDIIDPKRADKDQLLKIQPKTDSSGTYFVIPGNSYSLGVSEEYVKMPDDVVGICVGKSTNARVGIIANITPIEPGWAGYITLEFSNSSPLDVKLYAEGVCQLIFFRLVEKPKEVYGDRKYQNQKKEITLARVE